MERPAIQRGEAGISWRGERREEIGDGRVERMNIPSSK